MSRNEEIIVRKGPNVGIPKFGVSNVTFLSSKGMCGAYITELNRTLCDMHELVKQGADIVWSKTQNWCTVNGKVFNVPKLVYERRVKSNGELILYKSNGVVIN